MPILKPGQALPGSNDVTAPELQGVKVETNSILFQERLMKLFRPYDYVEIKNIDDAPLYWQYMPEENETERFDQTGVQREIYRTDPELWGILPGESEPLVGACAMRALDVLYKNVAAKKVLRESKDPNDPRKMKNGDYAQISFNFSDAGIQEFVIKKAFLGKINPQFGRPSVINAPTDVSRVEPDQAVASALAQENRFPEPTQPAADGKPVAKATANVGPTK